MRVRKSKAARSRHLLSLSRQAVRLISSNFLEVIAVRDHSEHHRLLRTLRDGLPQQAREIAEQHVLTAGRSLAEWLNAND